MVLSSGQRSSSIPPAIRQGFEVIINWKLKEKPFPIGSWNLMATVSISEMFAFLRSFKTIPDHRKYMFSRTIPQQGNDGSVGNQKAESNSWLCQDRIKHRPLPSRVMLYSGNGG